MTPTHRSALAVNGKFVPHVDEQTIPVLHRAYHAIGDAVKIVEDGPLCKKAEADLDDTFSQLTSRYAVEMDDTRRKALVAVMGKFKLTQMA